MTSLVPKENEERCGSSLQVGELCTTEWDDKNLYEALVIYISDEKSKCMKFLQKESEENTKEKKKSGQTAKKNTKKRKADGNNSNTGSTNMKPGCKSNTDKTPDDASSIKKQKHELQAKAKQLKAAQAAAAQDLAASLFDSATHTNRTVCLNPPSSPSTSTVTHDSVTACSVFPDTNAKQTDTPINGPGIPAQPCNTPEHLHESTLQSPDKHMLNHAHNTLTVPQHMMQTPYEHIPQGYSTLQGQNTPAVPQQKTQTTYEHMWQGHITPQRPNTHSVPQHKTPYEHIHSTPQGHNTPASIPLAYNTSSIPHGYRMPSSIPYGYNMPSFSMPAPQMPSASQHALSFPYTVTDNPLSTYSTLMSPFDQQSIAAPSRNATSFLESLSESPILTNHIENEHDKEPCIVDVESVSTPPSDHSPKHCSNMSGLAGIDCQIKDKEIQDLKLEINELKSMKYTEMTMDAKERVYKPKTRPEVPLSDYIEMKNHEIIPEGFQLLAPGAPIAVRRLWLHDVLSSIGRYRVKKEKRAEKKNRAVREDKDSEIIKRFMDGFFEPKDLAKEGGTNAFVDHPVFQGLKCYATHMLKMDVPKFNRCWNTKMATARTTVKRLSS